MPPPGWISDDFPAQIVPNQGGEGNEHSGSMIAQQTGGHKGLEPAYGHLANENGPSGVGKVVLRQVLLPPLPSLPFLLLFLPSLP